MKKIIKILLWVVGIVLALLIIVSLVAGPVAKSYINRNGEKLTGRHVEVKRVGVNLLTGSVKVQGLNLYEENGKEVFAGFDTLDVRAALLQLPFKTVNLRHITLAGLNAQVLQDGDRFNFSSLIEHFKSDKPDEEKDTTPSDWTLKFYNIRISHASLGYRDLQGNKELKLPDVNLRVPGFVMGAKERTEGGLNLNFDKGGHLNANAHYDADGGNLDAKVDLTGFALRNVEGYIKDIIDFDEVAGTLAAHVSLKGRTAELLKSHIAATVTLSDVDLQAGKAQVAGLKELNVKVNNINLDANSYDINEVHLDGLTATYEQWDGYTNISRLMKKKETLDTSDVSEHSEDSVTSEKPQKNPMQLHVGRLLVENCALTYVNHTLPEEFRFPVTNLVVKADDLSTQGDNNATLRATLPGGGLLAVRWQGNISEWKQHQDLFLTIKGLDMKQLSPWALAYIGQPIEDGVFSLTSRNSINNSNLNGKNTLDIYKIEVGKRRKDVDAKLKLPVKAALYILKDKDDKILIDMPIKGDVDNPEFNYMKVVWKTLGNLVVKVATSPARALGNALGLNGDDLAFMAVDPAQHGLTSEQYHTLGQLATVAQSDSLIVLTLERRMPEPANDTVARRYDLLNLQILRYLEEQGVPEGQVRIINGDAPDPAAGEKSGYAVGSEMKIDE
ncbi:MAG: DUF748 domain-containing protein [Bacteroidales bacterium]|nr:DUF748 domain-containing protein [Bacteroidales bacterium]